MTRQVSPPGTMPALNESPSEKEGKSFWRVCYWLRQKPSMKVPPKRKGNGLEFATRFVVRMWALNESPSEKEGKYQHHQRQQGVC